MTPETDPWQEIGTPAVTGEVLSRRADPAHSLDFFRGKIFGGRYFFRLVTGARPDQEYRPPNFEGIQIELAINDSGRSELTLHLENSGDLELFRALCADLMASTRHFSKSDEPEAFKVVLARLARWQRLLSERRSVLLSKNEQLGLFGELLILREVFMTRADPLTALNAWQGPSGAEQDFLLEGWLLESKAQMASSDRVLHISSADQLDLVSGQIVVVHQVFTVTDDGDGGARTLNTLAGELRDHIIKTQPFAVDLFEARLIEARYQNHEEYDLEYLELTSRVCFEVMDEFPRISASDLAAGIKNVRYQVAAEALTDFEREENEIMRRIFDASG